jgi:glycosyltransferase involved in cell wall biosynthesis
MCNYTPLVSIGMPVYNGERYIRKASDSLLAQDYENFELIISDNASTDETLRIFREYAAIDHRIKVYVHSHNLGAFTNYKNVLELAQGKYFMWAAVDDV